MSSIALVSFLELVSVLGCALTSLKLFRSGLYRRYRVFFAYFVYRVPFLICFLSLNTKSNIYFYFWMITLPLSWLFYVLVVRELCFVVLEDYKGLYTLGRWAMYVGVSVSVVMSILSLIPKISPAQRSRILPYMAAADRGVTFALAIFLILMLFLLSRYPVPLSRNVVVHAALFATFFFSNTLSTLLRVFGVRLYTAIDSGLMVVSSACALAWFFWLTPQGERVPARFPQLGAHDEKRIMAQLEALNRTLLKASRN